MTLAEMVDALVSDGHPATCFFCKQMLVAVPPAPAPVGLATGP